MAAASTTAFSFEVVPPEDEDLYDDCELDEENEVDCYEDEDIIITILCWKYLLRGA